MKIFNILLLCFFSGAFSLQATPDIADAFENSLNYEYEGNYSAALNSVLLILRNHGPNYTAVLRVGWLSYMDGKYKDATEYYNRAITLSPKSVEPLLGLLYPLTASKSWERIETVARKILTLDEKNYTASSKLAYALFMQGKFQDAVGVYKAVLLLYPSDLVMKNGLAWSYFRLGKSKNAEEIFRQVLSIQKNNVTALSGLEAINNSSPKK